MDKSFQSRFVEALRKRLYPHTNVHLKQIAGAIGRSENTIARWCHGESRVYAEDLDRLVRFFLGRGDDTFLRVLFPDALQPSESIEDRITELVYSAATRLAKGRGLPHESTVWFLEDGASAEAPFGHAEYVSRICSLPPNAGDVVRYAMSGFGWIAVTMRPDDTVIIRHDGRRVSQAAAERVCHWLQSHRNRIQEVFRFINVGRQWIEAQHESADLAAEAITKVAFIVSNPRRPWEVKRLPIAAINDVKLGALLCSYREAPERIVHVAAASGALTVSNVLAVEGDNVISLHAATDYYVGRQGVEGRNVLSRADTDYALMIRERILLTKRDGPTYCELSGTVDNLYVRYLNLALPEPGRHGKVLTSTVILDLKELAATPKNGMAESTTTD